MVGTTVDIKLWLRPLRHRDVVLLLSCWKRWDHGSISESAINTWLKNINLTYGPDCEDSPHFRRNSINDLEAMQLLGDSSWDGLAAELLGQYRDTTLSYLRNYNDPIYSSIKEQGKVLQSGLALTPMAWAHTRHTVDWAIAWALIGEWASKELFPCLVGWARAAFEQGSLPALLSLPGAGAPCSKQHTSGWTT